MGYRVCIPTAGTGSRLGGLTRYVNKSLVALANRPTLSHVIEQFPQDAEFVIPLGHKAHLVREYLQLAYPQRKFFFASVSPFEGPGSGLGLSLLTCKEFLQQPFIFISCDTLVKEPIPAPDQNWMGYAELDQIASYRTLCVRDGKVERICEKGEGSPETHKPYIGLAGIHDYKAFWEAMEAGGDKTIAMGESHGMRDLVGLDIRAHGFTWFDTGNPQALARTQEAYRVADAPNILEKANEAIWFVDGKVIKFSDDEKFIRNRVERVGELTGFVPEVTGSTAHMYSYAKVKGRVLSEAVTLPVFDKLLAFSKGFWQPHALDAAGAKAFHDGCMKFYRDKTLERVQLFYKNFKRQDGTESINGFAMPTLEELFKSLDWEWLAQGMSGRFHGDFHFENILWDADTKRFVFLDWRQDFGGDLKTGDVYYDLAKLWHGLIICHELIAQNQFLVEWGAREIRYDFHRKQMLVACEEAYRRWLDAEGYDRKKVWIMTALVYLNIAALHHYPYSLLLYALGKAMLFRGLQDAVD
ncbi:MAG: phosphotransferase [Bdellovibrionales bacterium]